MSLDPEDWSSFRRDAHAALDAILDDLASVADRPVWQRMPDEVRRAFTGPLPRVGADLARVVDDVRRLVMPYVVGNRHPRFFGWVHGGGNAVGVIAELLAAGLNPNLGGRDHAPVEVERQVVRWTREAFGFPETASGIVVTGTSMANFMAVVVAKTARLGESVRRSGLGGAPSLRAYASQAAHSSVARAMELAGLGRDALRTIAVDERQRIDVGALAAAIAEDRAAGHVPFLLVGNAGTVDVGAIDDLAALATLSATEGLWFHVDGAFGALSVLSPALAARVAGIERADSIAFDFHKWMQVPYDAGFLLVRDGAAHRAAFADEPHYLARATRGIAANAPWFTDFGPELSRGFRALKVWMTLRVYGADRLGAVIEGTCRLAEHLAARVRREPDLELVLPPSLNVVVLAHRRCAADALVLALQESGVAAPSTTRVGGRTVVRVAIVNHRTTERDLDVFVDALLDEARAAKAAP